MVDGEVGIIKKLFKNILDRGRVKAIVVRMGRGLDAFWYHTFYQLEGSAGSPSPAISKIITTMNLKFCRVLETSVNVLELLKLFT